MALRRLSGAGVIALALGLLLPSTALAASQLVTIQSFAFAPPATTINAGDSVTWTNRDPVSHTATADGGGFDTGVLAPGASATIKLSGPGTFGYHCAIHPSMKGTVTVVAPAPAPTPQPPPPIPAPTAPPPTAPPPAPILSPSPAPSPSPSPSPTALPSPIPTPTRGVTPAPTGTLASASPAAGPGGGLGSGPGPALAIGGVVLAAGLAGLALYLYRRK